MAENQNLQYFQPDRLTGMIFAVVHCQLRRFGDGSNSTSGICRCEEYRCGFILQVTMVQSGIACIYHVTIIFNSV